MIGTNSCFRVLGLLAWLSWLGATAAATPAQVGLDTSYYYRLTNAFLGSGQALDLKPDGSGRLQMAALAQVSGQSFRLVPRPGGKYALRNAYFGDGFSVDLMDDGPTSAPRMAETGDYSGQLWTLTPWGDGSYRLTNDFNGPTLSLDTHRKTHALFLGPGNQSGQHWSLSRLEKIVPLAAIPALDPKGDVYKTEGPTDFGMHQRPVGTVKAVMIFVDFPDAQATADGAAVGKHLLGGGKLQRYFKEQSHHKLNFEVTVLSQLGWKRMPKPSKSYMHARDPNKAGDAHRDYIQAAASLFSPAEVNFAEYAMVLVVPPEAAAFPISPAYQAALGQGAQTASGNIHLAVTLGTDSYDGPSTTRPRTDGHRTLAHEVGHLFGLPDEYATGRDAEKVGCWSMMSDNNHAGGYLGWDRHKNGWLDASRKAYVGQGSAEWNVTLTPLSAASGLSMVVLPIDDPHHPSKVFVVELAQPVSGTDNQTGGEGVLLYTVDATIPTAKSPVVILAKKTSESPNFGALYEAPYGVGDTARSNQGRAALTVKVLQKLGSAYNVQISYHHG